MIESKVLFKNRTLDWSDITKNVDKICAEILKSEVNIDCVVGLSRGGLIPAVMIANQLGVNKVYSYGLRSYSNKTGGDIQTYQFLDSGDVGHVEHVLVVDDISDRGETLGYVKKQLCKPTPTTYKHLMIHTCTLCFKPHTDFIPTWYGESVDNDDWVIFPWEADERKPGSK